MILSVHAVVGAGVASLIPGQPVAGFALAFASHLLLDAIPHRDYDLLSLSGNAKEGLSLKDNTHKRFHQLKRDMFLVSVDAVVGIILAGIFFYNPAYPFIFLIGALASMLPDFTTFLSLFYKPKILQFFVRFHLNVMHSKVVLKLKEIPGVCLQFMTIGVLFLIVWGLTNLFSPVLAGQL